MAMSEPDWSSLPSDLLHRVSDYLLSTNDIDYYMDMRAVCHNWRSATADPRRPGADHLLFRPRLWIILEEEPKSNSEDTRLFVHLTSGRFLRRRLPLLRDHILVATSDGLLVVVQSEPPLAIRIINPFTGSILRFATRMPCDRVIAGVTGSDPALVFSFDVRYDQRVCCADPTSALFCEQAFPRGESFIANIVAHAGHVYMVDVKGLVARSVGRVKHRHGGKLVAETLDVVACPREQHQSYKFFLVESTDELLLVRLDDAFRGTEVFRVDVELGVLVPVKSIGSRALFLGYRCLSVDTDKFPSVDGDSLYYTDGLEECGMSQIYELDLRSGSKVNISSLLEEPRRDSLRVRPFSFVQALLNYCVTLPDVQAQLRRFLQPALGTTRNIIFDW